MPLHDASYKHWDGGHLGIWRRRAVIALNGLKGCLQNKWMRHLVVLCWGAALIMVAVLFVIGQLLVADSIVVQWVGNLNPQLQAFVRSLISWLEQHPEVSVRTTQNVLFFLFSTNLVTLSLVAIAIAIPYLITRDMASNAIIVYSSKAVGRFDYLLGKFATVFGLLCLTWLGPLCVAWFLGNFLAPNWNFFWHSRAALGNVLLYVLTSMVILSLLALGTSAISSKEKTTVSLWIVWWVVGNVLVPIGHQTKPWLKFFSFRFNLDQISLAVFRLGDDLHLAENTIPILGNLLRGIRSQTLVNLDNPAIGGAIFGLAIMLAIATFIIAKKVKPE
jgi:hypothetical protein